MTVDFVVGTVASTFAISSSTGVITTAAAFNYESGTTSYGLANDASVLAVLVDDGSVTATAIIVITINEVNDAPTFSAASFTVNVDEEQSSGTALSSSHTATDQETETLTYTLVGELSRDQLLVGKSIMLWHIKTFIWLATF